LKSELEVVEDLIKVKQLMMSTKAIKNIRNNKKQFVTTEFNSLTKRLNFKLEIQLSEKQIKEMKASIEHKKEVIANSKERLEANQIT
jgi:hypothetical protein